MEFTEEQCKMIYLAIKYYQVHGASYKNKEQEICNQILDKTFKFQNIPTWKIQDDGIL